MFMCRKCCGVENIYDRVISGSQESHPHAQRVGRDVRISCTIRRHVPMFLCANTSSRLVGLLSEQQMKEMDCPSLGIGTVLNHRLVLLLVLCSWLSWIRLTWWWRWWIVDSLKQYHKVCGSWPRVLSPANVCIFSHVWCLQDAKRHL